MTSVMHTAVVEKYRSPDGMVLVYRSATVYVAATNVITVRQYTLKTTLTFSGEKRGENSVSNEFSLWYLPCVASTTVYNGYI